MEILTAIGNTTLKKRLIEEEFNVKFEDLQYQEAVLDILKKDKEIQVLYLNSLLPGELSIYEFINNILKINSNLRIIIILEKENETIKNFLNSKNIFDIFYNNKIKIEELINLIKNNKKEKYEEKVKKEKIIINKIKNKINKNKINNKINKIINKLIKNKLNGNKLNENKINENKINENKIISIGGTPGVGKTLFVAMLTEFIKNEKILIVDFDENKNINKLLNIKNGKNIFKEIKYNKNIYLLNLNKKICTEKETKNIIEEKIKKYEKIIIDLSNIFIKEIMEKIDLNIILIEPNLLELNKTKKLIDKYEEFDIEKNKIKLIFNKFNKYSINFYILKNIFSDFDILGKINFNIKYNNFINNKNKIIDKKTKNEYLKIIKNIGGIK